MLPPIDPAVLQRNPNFEILYKDLCTRKLNPNGSTRDTKKQRVHDEIRRVRISLHLPSTRESTCAFILPAFYPYNADFCVPFICLFTNITSYLIPSTTSSCCSFTIAYFHIFGNILASLLHANTTSDANLHSHNPTHNPNPYNVPINPPIKSHRSPARPPRRHRNSYGATKRSSPSIRPRDSLQRH
jgi:hypothetical protein